MYGRGVLGTDALRRLLIDVVDRWSGGLRTIFIDFAALPALADDLRVVTVDDSALDRPDGLAVPLANLVDTVYHSRHQVVGSLRPDGETDPQVRKVRTAFAIAVAVRYARSYLYDLSLGDVNHDDVALALLQKDWPLLAELFATALARVQFGAGSLISTEPNIDSSYQGLHARDDEAVQGDTRPIQDPVVSRKITAESYFNLQSAARQGDWESDDIVRMLEEHLFPDLHPELAYHTNVVSAEEWKMLHKWVFGW
jgi:hypothetical protein